MIFPVNYDHLGYDYLDRVNLYTIHSGVDLNFGRPYEDLGMEVKSIAQGKVVYSNYTKGWGNLVVVYHAAYGIWTRYTHLQQRCVVVGEHIAEGQKVGYLGNTGNSSTPHLHFDIIKVQLKKWTQYTRFMSIDKVRGIYEDPIKYINEIIQSEKPKEKGKSIKDMPPSAWAVESWEWAKKNGLLSDASYPKSVLNYERFSVLLQRFYKLLTCKDA